MQFMQSHLYPELSTDSKLIIFADVDDPSEEQPTFGSVSGWELADKTDS